MESSLTSHLLRRGLSAANQHMQENPPVPDGDEILRRLRSFGSIALFSSTVILFFLGSFAIEYTIRFVIGNLAIVEDTKGGSPIRLPVGNDPDAPLEKEPLLDQIDLEKDDVAEVPSQPITRKLRSTTKHLHSIGGFKARFRGLKYFSLFAVPAAILSALLHKVLGRSMPLGKVLADIITVVLTARLHYLWTHATITAQSDKRICQKMLPRSQSKHLILPAIRSAIASNIVLYATTYSAMFAQRKIHRMGNVMHGCAAVWSLLPLGVAMLSSALFVFPAMVARIRVEASLIPESDEVIVPFDRTFGGRIDRSEGQSRRSYFFRNATFPGAWRTIDSESLRRIMKVYVKYFLIMMAVSTLFFFVIAFEFFLVFGEQAQLILMRFQCEMKKGM